MAYEPEFHSGLPHECPDALADIGLVSAPSGVPAASGRNWGIRIRTLGPGLIAGASDADPTTVATLAVIGASTTYAMGWLVLSLFPLLVVIQTIATRVGLASRLDLQGTVALVHGRWVRWLLLGSVLAVNIVTIAADLEAGAAALGLLTRGDWHWFVAPLSALLLAVVLALGLQVLQRALRYLLLILFVYAAAAVLARPDWPAVAVGTLVPNLRWDKDLVFGAMSLIGTTATSYVYIWQTIAQSEARTPWTGYRLRRFDAVAGCFFATVVFWFILIATGATLGTRHLAVATAQDAAQALRPVAGDFAGDLFALGLLASTLVALPVIIATTAYITGTHLNWPRGLSLRPRQAPRFFAAMGISIALGTGAAYTSVPPITILYWAGIIGAIGTPIGLVLLLKAAHHPQVMGDKTVGRRLLAAGWAVAGLIAVVCGAGLWQMLQAVP
ncbi:NRAMP family divalent metal transporter [Streptomyces orinoci]|uniref:Divalent metal cation transporter n=1 Tax=Streptomyces orinoci TaxID=67339 RepID=A0ABV3K0L8_STRON|nr:divalent metal cation transporter [Streptomyces orinoci]